MSKERKDRALDLDQITVEFAKIYCKPGSGITARATSSGIKVTVKKLTDASTLPVSFQGARLEVYQDLGSPLGERLIIRNDDGTIAGTQG
jgi:hypothetical protein